MQTNDPEVSRELLLELAKKCGLIGAYSTQEINEAIVGYAQVVLRDKAVQEAFVRANPQKHEVHPKGRYTCKPNRCDCHPETCCCSDYIVLTPDGDVLMKTNKGPEVTARLNGEWPE